MTIDPGDKAPAFKLTADDSATYANASLMGQPYVLYFYPKDDTPGCTREACAFQANLPDFTKLGALVLGVSKDGPASHQKFRAKYGLAFPLLSDPDLATIQAFGVWKEKVLYGKKSLGLERSTFLVDAKGVVRKVWRKVKVDGHAEAVLEALKAL
jgi:peroxiredoxin Q/BCP